MREIVHIQAGQCGNQIGAKVRAVSRLPAEGRATGTGVQRDSPAGVIGERSGAALGLRAGWAVPGLEPAVGRSRLAAARTAPEGEGCGVGARPGCVLGPLSSCGDAAVSVERRSCSRRS